MYIESETVELKAKYTDTLQREIVSFLNTNGGTIFIGIDDGGTVVGVENTDNTLKNISNCITDQIEPSPYKEITSEIIYEDNKPIIAIKINKGIKPLYAIKKYGFSSKGCLVRIGTTCKEMSLEEIQFRYKLQFTNEDYMLMVQSKFSPLSFDMMKILLTSRGLHVNDNAFESSFNLKRNDGSYNLLAEILSDKNMISLVFVKFLGTDKTSISQRSDYGTQSILLGYQKMKARLEAENICKVDTTTRPRKEIYLYDMDCVNEALVNMLVHNDWTITEPLVSFYSDRIVFTSHGGIPNGITKEEFFEGVSKPRNTVLMRIFLNLGIVEHTGHGVPTIVKKYGKEAFDIHDSFINVEIPFNKEVLSLIPTPNNNEINKNNLSNELSDIEGNVILELVKNQGATYDELTKELGISRRSISRIISGLIEKKYIKRVGNNCEVTSSNLLLALS